MSDFKFDLQAGGTGLILQVGFNSEIATVSHWKEEWGPRVGTFLSIPSGPVLIKSVGPSVANTLQILESEDPGVVASFAVNQVFYSNSAGTFREFLIEGGAVYSSFHNLAGPFIAIRIQNVDFFTVESYGIPERAPATMWREPNPLVVTGGR